MCGRIRKSDKFGIRSLGAKLKRAFGSLGKSSRKPHAAQKQFDSTGEEQEQQPTGIDRGSRRSIVAENASERPSERASAGFEEEQRQQPTDIDRGSRRSVVAGNASQGPPERASTDVEKKHRQNSADRFLDPPILAARARVPIPENELGINERDLTDQGTRPSPLHEVASGRRSLEAFVKCHNSEDEVPSGRNSRRYAGTNRYPSKASTRFVRNFSGWTFDDVEPGGVQETAAVKEEKADKLGPSVGAGTATPRQPRKTKTGKRYGSVLLEPFVPRPRPEWKPAEEATDEAPEIEEEETVKSSGAKVKTPTPSQATKSHGTASDAELEDTKLPALPTAMPVPPKSAEYNIFAVLAAQNARYVQARQHLRKLREEEKMRRVPTEQLHSIWSANVGWPREKYFGEDLCKHKVDCDKVCGLQHKTEDHNEVIDCWEVWRGVYDGPASLCASPDCKFPKHHFTKHCRMGQFFDHWANPPLPERLSKWRNPWPAGHVKIPLPMYWFKPQQYAKQADQEMMPDLPADLKEGLEAGLWDTYGPRSRSLQISLQNAFTLCRKLKQKRLDYAQYEPSVERLETWPVGTPSAKVSGKDVASAEPPKLLVEKLPPELDVFRTHWPEGLPGPQYTPWETTDWFANNFVSTMDQYLSVEDRRTITKAKETWKADYALYQKHSKNQKYEGSVHKVLLKAWRLYMKYFDWVEGKTEFTPPSAFLEWIEEEAMTWEPPSDKCLPRRRASPGRDTEYWPAYEWGAGLEDDEIDDEARKHPMHEPRDAEAICSHYSCWLEMLGRTFSEERVSQWETWTKASAHEALVAIGKWMAAKSYPESDVVKTMEGHFSAFQHRTLKFVAGLRAVGQEMEKASKEPDKLTFDTLQIRIKFLIEDFDADIDRQLRGTARTTVYNMLETAVMDGLEPRWADLIQGLMLPVKSMNESILIWFAWPSGFARWEKGQAKVRKGSKPVTGTTEGEGTAS